MAGIVKYSDLGKQIAAGWGRNDCDGDGRDQVIKAAKNDDMMMFLLCGVLDRLERIAKIAELEQDRNELDRRIANRKKDEQNDHISDGMLQAFVSMSGAVRIPDEPQEDPACRGLSVRAQKTLWKLRKDIVLIKDITIDDCLKVRNCGISTAYEIMAWRDAAIGLKSVPEKT